METRRLPSIQRQQLSNFSYVFLLMNLHNIDKVGKVQSLEIDSSHMHISKIRTLKDCLVYLAWINRLWSFYFWSAVKNFRWLYHSVSPSGRVESFTHFDVHF